MAQKKRNLPKKEHRCGIELSAIVESSFQVVDRREQSSGVGAERSEDLGFEHQGPGNYVGVSPSTERR